MNVATSNRPKLELNESLSSDEDISRLENKQINLSSNEIAVIQYRTKNAKFQQQEDTSKIFIKRVNTITSSVNELLETNNSSMGGRTPNISTNEPIINKNSNYISQSARKEVKTTGNSIINLPRTKLGEYLQRSEKSKFKERKDSPFLVVKKTLNFDEEVKKNKKERRDAYGTVICKKNRRKVQVSFVDWISDEPLTDVVYIESFKGLNYMRNMPKEDFMVKPTCECCGIF